MPHALRHEALPYRGHDQFVTSSLSVLREGLEREERMIFLAAQAKVDSVRQALGPDVDGIALVATDEHGRNPSRITTMLHSFQAHGDGRRTLGLHETMSTGRRPGALVELLLAEAALNLPELASWPMSVVCLYDLDDVDADYADQMRRSHPVIRGEHVDNHDYDDTRFHTLYSAALPPPSGSVSCLDVVDSMLTQLRAFVHDVATGLGLRPDRVDDLVLAANEIATNSIRHGGGRCVVSMWDEDGCAVCEVHDRGYLADPLVGRLTPSVEASSGRGLWLSNHLCDLMQVRSSEHDGTVVRLAVER